MNEVERAMLYHTEQARRLWRALWMTDVKVMSAATLKEILHHETQIDRLLIPLICGDKELPDEAAAMEHGQ